MPNATAFAGRLFHSLLVRGKKDCGRWLVVQGGVWKGWAAVLRQRRRLGRSGLLCDVRGVGWAGVGCCVTSDA